MTEERRQGFDEFSERMVVLETEFTNHVKQEEADRREDKELHKELIRSVQTNTTMIEKLDTKMEKQKSWYAGFSAAIVLVASVLAFGLKKMLGY